MLIIDSHLDLSSNGLQANRDLRRSVYTIRAGERRPTTGESWGGTAQGTVAFPEMRRGRMVLSFATLLARCTGHPVPFLDYPSLAQAYGVAQGQLAYYKALAAEGELRIVASKAELDQHVAEWEAWDDLAAPDPAHCPPLGIVISMESADSIPDPAQLEAWWQAGVRVIGPAHYGPGRYAGGTGTESGLTDLGQPLLAEMQRLGIILDATHFSDTAFWEALTAYQGPVLASHNNCRALVPHQRQFSDDQIRAVCERDGVIGAAFDIWMLVPGFLKGQSNRGVTLSNVVDHIDYICQLTGSSRHAAIGTDLDGGYGREQSPSDLDTIADLQKLPDLLSARGYTSADIAAIMHGNWLRLLRSAWT